MNLNWSIVWRLLAIFFYMDNQITGLFIRYEILQCSKLNVTEKILLALIDSLDNSDKGCYASNKFLADTLQFSEQTVANMVYKLRKKGALLNTFYDGKNRGLRVFIPCSGEPMLTPTSNDKLTPESKDIQKLTQIGNEGYSNDYGSLPNRVTDIIIYNKDNKDIYREKDFDDTDWVKVAQAMIEYAKGEGKNQWAFMAGMYNYQEDPDKLISLWCSKAQPYELKNWKKNFRNLTTWIKNEAKNTFRSAQATEKKDEKPVRDCGYPIYDPKTMKGLRVDCLKMEIDGLPWYVDCDYKPICIVEEWRHRYEL